MTPMKLQAHLSLGLGLIFSLAGNVRGDKMALFLRPTQAMEAAQLADELKAQLELAQKKLHDFQDEIVENSVTKEKDMFNFKRAQVRAVLFAVPC